MGGGGAKRHTTPISPPPDPRHRGHPHYATVLRERRPTNQGASPNGTPHPFPHLPRTFHGALSGRENAAFLARIYGARMRNVIDYVAAFAELAEYFDMPVNTYSAGMRGRLAFAACLAIDFDVYLIDEVTEIGDQRFRRKCAEAFRERMARSDIILVTHNPQTLRQYCDRGAVLADGALSLYDDIGAALSRYHRTLQEQN
jgi:capsular polysaccharide transport system ATP-binding protein